MSLIESRADWLAAAACLGMPADVFHPARGDHVTLAQALAVCATCPVTAECLAEALESPYAYDLGVRAGLSERARHRLRERRSRPLAGVSRHGTRSRYVVGCRCDDCTDANREYARARAMAQVVGPTDPQGASETVSADQSTEEVA